jgi:hypothetical protein
MAADRLAEQGQQLHLHQHLDSAEAEVQALARTTRKMVLFYDFLVHKSLLH